MLKYLVINFSFALVGFLLSYVVDIGRLAGLSDAHDMGFGNLMLTTLLFLLLGLVYTAFSFYTYKVLLTLSATGFIAVMVLMYLLLFS